MLITAASARICKTVEDVYLVYRQEVAKWGGCGLARAHTHILSALHNVSVLVLLLLWLFQPASFPVLESSQLLS